VCRSKKGKRGSSSAKIAVSIIKREPSIDMEGLGRGTDIEEEIT